MSKFMSKKNRNSWKPGKFVKSRDLGKLKTKLTEKQDKFLLVNCTHPARQVLLEMRSSKIKAYSSQRSGRVEVFFPKPPLFTTLIFGCTFIYHVLFLCQEIGLLRQLLYLDVSKNRLERLPPEIESLQSLTDLYLSNNLLLELLDNIGKYLEIKVISIKKGILQSEKSL